MLRLIAFALAACCYLQSGLAMADEAAKRLVGSWRLTSWVIQVVGGEATEPFGPNPKGRAVFTSDEYVAFIIAGANRKPASNNDESAALLKSLLAYTGKFTIDGDKVYNKRRHIVERDFDWHGPNPVLQTGGRQALSSNGGAGQRGLPRQEGGGNPHLGA